MNKYLVFFFYLLISISVPGKAYSLTYHCNTTAKYDFSRTYTQEELNKGKFSVRVEEDGKAINIYRCSFALSQDAVTCDKYEVNRVELDPNAKIKKYYYFRGQYNFQIFSNLKSLEDNGRGSIQYGKCEIQ